ncbi:MAG: transcriptional repressor [Eubacteriales bacterium]|nr:transcriptional repressor [Eubacteriales bacterium]
MRYKEIILELINSGGDHFTAEQIFFMLKKRYPGMVLATVYNNLNTLCKNGDIRRVVIEGEPDRFDRNTRHDHLVCSRCKKVTDVQLEDLTAQIESQLGYSIELYDLRIGYVCPECKKSK